MMLSRSLLFGACLTPAPALAMALGPSRDAAAAQLSVVQLERFDNQHNGSIDVDSGVGHNLRQDGPIECNLRLDGPVEPGDLEKLVSLVGAQRARDLNNVPRLCLSSPGGDYREGLRIAEYLMTENIGTAVAGDAECYSACAIVFMGGTFPWKGEINRYLHARGILGFHAPYIPDAEGKRLVDADQVRLAFAEGIKSMSEFMRLGVGNRVKRIEPDLMAEMLAQGPNDFYLVDTIGKAIRFRIHLFGIDRPPAVDDSGMCNACVNMNYFALERYGTGGDSDLCKDLAPPRRETFPKGARWTNDIAPRMGECAIDVTIEGGGISQWMFRNDDRAEFADGQELAYWYLLSPSTRLAELSRKPERAAATGSAQDGDGARLRDQLYRFVVMEYLGHGTPGHEGRSDLFAERVGYYKQGIISRQAVLAEKARYYKRWPQRRYAYIADSLSAAPGANDTVTITFRYDFEVANDKQTRRGVGTTTLGIGLIGGRFTIVSEDGGVEPRSQRRR
jgi:hypothetical protein